jgi:hypothetical protein
MGLSGTDQRLPGPVGKSHFRDSWLLVILPHKDIRKKTWEILFLFTLKATRIGPDSANFGRLSWAYGW